MTTRPKLTPSELTFARICFERINPDLLQPGPRALFEALASYFAWYGTLSPKQLASLKNLKLSHDLTKRSTAIALGRIRFDDDARADSKLNIVYNPVRQKH